HKARLDGGAPVGERQAGHGQSGSGRVEEAEQRQSPPGIPKGSVGLGGNEGYDTTAANGVPSSYRCLRFVLHTRSFLPWKSRKNVNNCASGICWRSSRPRFHCSKKSRTAKFR